MLFTIQNQYLQNIEQLRKDGLVDAYYIITSYPLRAADKLMDKFLQSRYNSSLKNLCIDLLLNLSFYKNKDGDLVLLFKNPKHDYMARLITYGNGAIPGSKILQVALNTRR